MLGKAGVLVFEILLEALKLHLDILFLYLGVFGDLGDLRLYCELGLPKLDVFQLLLHVFDLIFGKDFACLDAHRGLIEGLVNLLFNVLLLRLVCSIDALLQSFDLVLQFLSCDSVFEQFFAVFDAPQNLASVVVQLLVEFGHCLVQQILVLDDALRLLLKLLCDEA